VLGVFQKFPMPPSIKFQQFLVRVGEFGGYAVMETDKPADVHKLTTALAVFQFRLEPVIDVMDAVAVESAHFLTRTQASYEKSLMGIASARAGKLHNDRSRTMRNGFFLLHPTLRRWQHDSYQ
jgi:hypothetical protein